MFPFEVYLFFRLQAKALYLLYYKRRNKYLPVNISLGSVAYLYVSFLQNICYQHYFNLMRKVIVLFTWRTRERLILHLAKDETAQPVLGEEIGETCLAEQKQKKNQTNQPNDQRKKKQEKTHWHIRRSKKNKEKRVGEAKIQCCHKTK